jgi:hypothetical protein
MSIIKIKPISGSKVLIGKNEKMVILDNTFGWTSVTNDLTTKEVKAFQNYQINYIDNNSVKTLPTITYDL